MILCVTIKTPSSVQNCHEVNQSWTLPIQMTPSMPFKSQVLSTSLAWLGLSVMSTCDSIWHFRNNGWIIDSLIFQACPLPPKGLTKTINFWGRFNFWFCKIKLNLSCHFDMISGLSCFKVMVLGDQWLPTSWMYKRLNWSSWTWLPIAGWNEVDKIN